MGMQCYHVVHARSPGPPSVSREGDVCGKCWEAGYSPETVPEEYRELFRAAQVLFDEGITEEHVIIPTLAFAANSSEKPELKSVRDEFVRLHDKFAKAGKASEARESQEWQKLDDQFFYNSSTTLQSFKIVDEVLIVRSLPIETLSHVDEETGSVVQVEINVYEPWMTKDDVSESYERHLLLFELSYKEGQGGICLRENPFSTTIRIVACPESQGIFPGPDAVGHMYDYLRKRLIKRLAEVDNTPAKQTKKTEPKKPYNLIPACVYWYVGNRGEVLRTPRGSDLKRKTYALVEKHLVERLPDEIQNKILLDKAKREFPRDARLLEQRILRVDDELRLQAARLIPLMSK